MIPKQTNNTLVPIVVSYYLNVYDNTFITIVQAGTYAAAQPVFLSLVNTNRNMEQPLLQIRADVYIVDSNVNTTQNRIVSSECNNSDLMMASVFNLSELYSQH